jgi:hypothetical protein
VKKITSHPIDRTTDGNGEFPVGDRAPIPVPAGTKFPRPAPVKTHGGLFATAPIPRGESIPDGVPVPARWRSRRGPFLADDAAV